ncbi:MAG: glycosyltransferase, partial [Bryobacteraceae bacterium]
MTRLSLVAVIEASTVTGPAKNLIEFCSLARCHDLPGLPRVDASIVTYVRGDRSTNSFLTAVNNAGIPVAVIEERGAFDTRVLGALRRIVEQRAPHILQTHNIKSHFLAKLSGIRKRGHWIAFHHGYTSTDFKMLAYNQLDRWSLPSAERVITVCQPFAHELQRIGVPPEKLSVLHNSVRPMTPADPQAVQALRESLGIPEHTRVILSAGRLSREKGHLDLIEAAALLAQNSSLDWKLVIAGAGPDQDRLAQSIARHKLAERVLL